MMTGKYDIPLSSFEDRPHIGQPLSSYEYPRKRGVRGFKQKNPAKCLSFTSLRPYIQIFVKKVKFFQPLEGNGLSSPVWNVKVKFLRITLNLRQNYLDGETEGA